MTIQEYLSSNDESLVRIGFELLKRDESLSFKEKDTILKDSGFTIYWGNYYCTEYARRFTITAISMDSSGKCHSFETLEAPRFIGRIYHNNARNL